MDDGRTNSLHTVAVSNFKLLNYVRTVSTGTYVCRAFSVYRHVRWVSVMRASICIYARAKQDESTRNEIDIVNHLILRNNGDAREVDLKSRLFSVPYFFTFR
jgi:hypothetical protein